MSVGRPPRWVLDTNVALFALIRPGGTCGRLRGLQERTLCAMLLAVEDQKRRAQGALLPSVDGHRAVIARCAGMAATIPPGRSQSRPYPLQQKNL